MRADLERASGEPVHKSASLKKPFNFDDVYRAELEVLAARRARCKLSKPPFRVDKPSTQNQLTGIALSGGGIRSATFCLGVLQSLARTGAFAHFDYLSTVSGGGFVGAAVSAALDRRPRGESEDELKFPFPPSGDPDTDALTHFRAHANYLNPGGILSGARFPALLLRGVLLNVLALIPWLMLTVLLTGVGYVYAYNEGHLEWLKRAPLALAVPFLLLLVTYPLTVPLASRGLPFRERYDRIFSGALLLAVIGVLLTGLFDAAIWALETPTEEADEQLQKLLAVLHLPLIASLLCAAFIGARFLAPKTMHRLTRVGLYVAGALVPLVCLAVYLYQCMTQIESARLPRVLERGELPSVERERVAIPERLCKPLHNRGVKWDRGKAQVGDAADKCPGESQIVQLRCDVRPGKDACFGLIIPYTVLDGKKPLLRWDAQAKTLRLEQLSFERLFDLSEPGDRELVAVCVLVFLLYLFVLDANSMSLHGFYRDSLSRLFLLPTDTAGDSKSDLKVSALAPGSTGAPYPIINATINLQGANEPAFRDRSGDSFAITPLFSGGRATKYAKTSDIEEADSRFGLASAVAISAAAAGPHMGSFTVRSLTLLLTLFNIRLGYWLPNPSKLALGTFSKKPPGPRHIWREALGAVHANGRFVNVSDGGHFENLGVYELLRRKCSLIVVIDGEEDSGHRFNGFIRLLHLARVDFGVIIDADLAEIRQAADGMSPRHFLWADIRYGARPGESVERGRLLYIKASFTGDEAPGLQAYRSHSPKFPHESTADQFFSETQFEAYRVLGEHVGDQTIEDSQLLSLLGADAAPHTLRLQRHRQGTPPLDPA